MRAFKGVCLGVASAGRGDPRGSSSSPSRPPPPPPLLLGPGKRQGWIPEQPPLLLLAGWLMSQLTPALQPRLAAPRRALCAPPKWLQTGRPLSGFGGQRK